MAADDVLSLRVVGRYQDQNVVNTLHYQILTQEFSELEVCEGLIELWDTAMRVLWAGRHIDTYELVGLKCFRVDGAAKTPAFKLVTAPGTVVGDELPSSVCRTITLYTASPKHRRRGRVMLSGTAAAHIRTTDGGVTAAEVALMNTMADELTSELVSNGDAFKLCLPATDVDPAELITDYAARVTPSLISSRRIQQFLIG